jgi:preprotein translocase subunit YajC
MHMTPGVLAASLAASSSSSTPKASAASSAASLIFIVLLGVLVYLFFIRPRSQQARRQRENLQEINVGDEILTGAGIFGRVLDIEADRITIETAPGTRITVLRSTVARRITEPADDSSSTWAGESDSADSGSKEQGALSSGGERDEEDSSWDRGEGHEQSGGDAAAGGR